MVVPSTARHEIAIDEGLSVLASGGLKDRHVLCRISIRYNNMGGSAAFCSMFMELLIGSTFLAACFQHLLAMVSIEQQDTSSMRCSTPFLLPVAVFVVGMLQPTMKHYLDDYLQTADFYPETFPIV